MKTTSRKLSPGTAIVVATISVGTLCASLIPESIISSSLVIKFTNLIATLIPTIDQMASVSRFPEVTRFFMSLVWALLPLYVFLVSRIPKLVSFHIDKVRQQKFLFSVAMLGLPTLAFFVAIFLIADDGEKDLQGWMLQEIVLRAVSDSKIWLGIFGSGLLLALSFLTAAVLFWLRSIPDIYFNKSR